MGERQVFQPLTREDKITVVLYRVGIVLSVLIIAGLSYLLATYSLRIAVANILGYSLQVSVGMTVLFIHLYVRKIKTYLMGLYVLSLGCLAALILVGKGSPAAAFMQGSYGPLLLLPLSGCLGFVTAKEAFCFQLFEGYLLAMLMPFYLLLVAVGALSGTGASSGLVLIAALLVLFMLRKVFQPLSYDIGDKSAYR